MGHHARAGYALPGGKLSPCRSGCRSARGAFAARARAALGTSLAKHDAVAWDAERWLYRGETSFLDGRERAYRPWTAKDTVHIGASLSLSTNVLHLRALRVAAQLAEDAGAGPRATSLRFQADALAAAGP